MKITHPFVVLIVGGSFLAGMTWWWSSRDTTPQANTATAATAAVVHREEPVSLPTADSAPAGAQDSALPIERTRQEPDASPATQPPAESPWEAEAKRLVTDGLKDPSSAMFREIRALSGDQVCGQVNAKNSFGGYVGYRWFWIKGMDRENPTVMVDSDSTLAELICDSPKN